MIAGIVVALSVFATGCSNGDSGDTASGCGAADYTLMSDAMLPAMDKYEPVYADERVYELSDPARGDVVTLKITPRNEIDTLIKRVVGLPGEEIELTGGRVLVDGVALEEPWYDGETSPTADETKWSLGADEYFVMGDNRAASTDSRDIGPIKRAAIEGRVCVLAEMTTTS
jgi:signal peptidase I